MSHKFKTPDAILSLHHLRIINCNSISSPLTWGFPAISAFAGFTEALNRKIQKVADFDVELKGVGVICHEFDPQVNKADGQFEWTFKQTRNPLEKKGGNAVSASLQEEGRCHIDITLVIGVYGDLEDDKDEDNLETFVLETMQTMRIAGGSVLPATKRYPRCKFMTVPPNKAEREKLFRRFRRSLMPGFALVDRSDYLEAHVEQMQKNTPNVTAIDGLLDLSRLTSKCAELSEDKDYRNQEEKEDKKYEWEVQRKPGWFVPIPIGYVGISELYGPGEIARCRDMHVPAQFVESVYSIGEWVSPHRISELNNILWFHDYREDDDLYLLVNNYQENINN
ncbi:type I-F CRISPR-associated protein Csy2 [Maridesulfovibrio hydrothermalis]|uniref:CRISPR-associated protein, Csy2 family n=1 Tax=Maridesulfovibrio hydrothermalis AM13 = DSM 14728 TaxID=1121451 RepID=L0RCH7_9BACT|nr:type I-F CRISPR-associated protein Csy2 [Maridesulfovibrio hydrothermalis]CCO24444.1 conserved protein of unknown function [Maridesulfovibrio hydrothermalis AM13 = DSM 14728]